MSITRKLVEKKMQQISLKNFISDVDDIAVNIIIPKNCAQTDTHTIFDPMMAPRRIDGKPRAKNSKAIFHCTLEACHWREVTRSFSDWKRNVRECFFQSRFHKFIF